MRQLAAIEALRADLDEVDCSIFAASVDPRERALETAEASGASFSFAYGVTREQADAIGAWWSEGRGGFIQPSEFLIWHDNAVLASLYASGPVGRMAPSEALTLIRSRERQRLAAERG